MQFQQRAGEVIETTPEAKMDCQSYNLSGSAYRNFLAILPISDGMVTIRAMSDEDAEAYAAGADDALVKRFAHLPLEKYSPQIVRDLIRGVIGDGLRDGTLAVLTIADSSSDSFLGSLVFFDINQDDAEIGYWVAPEHRGRKVSGRALALALEISRVLGLKRLRARTVQNNPASERVLLNEGFKQEGEARPDIVPSGRTEMSVSYTIEV
ncbi:GNAT family N-acetyltransferase [Brucella anthropi]|uniref:GNAT family N-acetyltransferase n=1 Tax=Brucella anthropi TaxID=529 RepID=A0A6I0DTN1_BRUAN|nr:GNAT family protein [Brucella anthropi]KAB2803096.1 GNAT family N-acetyltransferase [Brucella anthropi]